MVDSSLAIEAALCSDWKKAIKINQEILKENPNNIDALNRLGYALLNSGLLKKAKKVFEKVIKLDPFNPIATKNLNKLKDISQKHQTNNQIISPKVFLEEPGITKTVNLINLTTKSILSTLSGGQAVSLNLKKRRIEVRKDNLYLGALPDDLSFKLKKLIKRGNKYCAFIKSVDEEHLTIIIREVQRGKKVKDASFIGKPLPSYHSSIRSELLEELLEEERSLEEEEE